MNCKRAFRQLALATAVAAGLASPSFAATYNLSAGATTITVAGQSVPVWGFACTSTTVAGACPVLGTITVPGPELVVPPGEDLTVNLTNSLPEAVSVVIPGVAFPAVSGGVAQGVVADAQGRARITSFTGQAAAAGGTASFTWTGLAPGTYLYQSGSHVTQQVHMGLYGAVTKDFAAGEAYSGVVYDTDVLLFYSEVDPALHAAAAPANAVNYKPTYFLVNGKPFETGDPAVATVTDTQRVLLRFLNAGLKTHVPTLEGAYVSLVAEDGKPYPYPREQYSLLLTAGKTLDAIFNPAVGTYAIWDRSLHLSNAGAAGGGMYSTIEVLAAGAPAAPNLTFSATEDIVLNVPAPGVLGGAAAGAAPGLVRGRRTGSLAAGATASLVSGTTAGALTLNDDGSFSYAPNANFNGTDSFTYRAFTNGNGSNVARVTLAVAPVNDLPEAVDDSFVVEEGSLLSIPDPGVLGNDRDVDGDQLTAARLSSPPAGALSWSAVNNGAFTYAAAAPGTYTFRYRISDGAGLSRPANVTITVTPRVNKAPVAVNDFADTRQSTSVLIRVLSNDNDPDGDALLPASVTIVSQPSRGGTVTVNPANGSVVYTPKLRLRGTDTFSYTVKDSSGATSNVALVRVNVLK